jgi:CRISPR-associated protein Cmr3
MAYYHFTLQPLDAFFFGDERSFNSDENANYFVRSRLWPQQSTLLGALRYALLARKGLLHAGRGPKTLSPEAKNYIGGGSFDPDAKNPQPFGKIARISAVFLQCQGKRYVPAPLDQHMLCDLSEENQIDYQSLASSPIRTGGLRFYTAGRNAEGKEILAPWLAKDRLAEGLLGEGDSRPISWEEVLKPREQVGITKGAVEDEEKGFYRQLRYQMKPGWSFGFYAEIRDDDDPDSFRQTPGTRLPVGGEKTPFWLEAEPANAGIPDFGPTPPQVGGLSRVHLLSDAYVEQVADLLSACSHAFIGDAVDFRAVATQTLQTEEYASLSKRGEAAVPRRAGFSSLYQLIPRASVLYVSQAEWPRVLELLTAPANWRNIGYNAFQIRPCNFTNPQHHESWHSGKRAVQ